MHSVRPVPSHMEQGSPGSSLKSRSSPPLSSSRPSGGDKAAEDDARGERLVGEPLRIAYVNARTNCGIAAAVAARVSRRR